MTKKRWLWLWRNVSSSRWGVVGARIKLRQSVWERHAAPLMSMAYTMRRSMAATRIHGIQHREPLVKWWRLRDQLARKRSLHTLTR